MEMDRIDYGTRKETSKGIQCENDRM
jgi:hypothetical protein